jgi:phosphatidylglycerol lysyltransferase
VRNYTQGEPVSAPMIVYKQKFDPVWEPRYLASPGGLALPRILANITALIGGGLRGVVAR